MNTPAWIGLGSNLGDRKATLDAAVAALADSPGVTVRAVSSYHETRPVGGPPGQGPFLNAALHLETTLDPHHLLAVAKEIENQAGRVRKVRWGERTLDIDILIFGTKFLNTPELKLPHPRLAFRRFVLAPLAEIAPSIVDTMTRRTITDLLANLDRRPRLLTLDGPSEPTPSLIHRRLVEELPGFGIRWEDLGPPSDREVSPIQAVFDILERRAEALRASHWANEKLRVPWIVANYDLGLDLLATRRRRTLAADPERSQRVQAVARGVLNPTLVVRLPGEPEIRPKPGFLATPQLWPESDEPDAIVAEVLATCRAIEAG